ncbi:MAG: hypothetical protein EPN91_12250 [Salinibacterium sp.]|nr:MAG: hypothetical protein EPN91_12250 [Salinibacterium sp.]
MKVLGIFLVSRVVTTALLLGFASVQNTNPWTGPKPDYFHFAGIWDGFWYFIIAVGGYPNQLPTTSDGYVGENAWAFMPAYPMVVRIVMHVTTLDYSVASVIVSVGFALGTALLFYKLMSLVLPSNTALFAVVLFCFAPLSPIMQVAYAESMHTFLLTLALYLLLKGRYWLMVPVVAVMSLTRPSGMAFALLMLLHVVYRWWRSRPSAANREEFPFDERVASVALAFFSAFMGIAWVLIAWAVTGSVTAYTDTEMAWRSAYVGRAAFLPFTPWFQAVDRFWAPWWGIPNWLLIGMLVLAIAAFFGLLFTPWVRRLGVDLRLWVASYGVYLLAVFFPQSSTFRLLVPMFPLLGAFAIPRSRVYRVAIVLLFVLGQWAWIYMAWWVDGYDWTPP